MQTPQTPMTPTGPTSPLPPLSSVPQTQKPGGGRKATLLWVLLGILILAVAGWYFYGDVLDIPFPSGVTPSTYAPPQGDDMTSRLQQQGSSDDLNAIEADLNATNLNGLDKEFADIDAQLE